MKFAIYNRNLDRVTGPITFHVIAHIPTVTENIPTLKFNKQRIEI